MQLRLEAANTPLNCCTRSDSDFLGFETRTTGLVLLLLAVSEGAGAGEEEGRGGGGAGEEEEEEEGTRGEGRAGGFLCGPDAL